MMSSDDRPTRQARNDAALRPKVLRFSDLLGYGVMVARVTLDHLV